MIIMSPLIICSCALFAVILWIIYAISTAIYSIIDAVADTIVETLPLIIKIWLSVIGIYFLFLIIADYQMILNAISSLFSNILSTIVSLILIGIVIGSIIYIIAAFGSIIISAISIFAAIIVEGIIRILEFIMINSGRGFIFFIKKIKSRLNSIQGGIDI